MEKDGTEKFIISMEILNIKLMMELEKEKNLINMEK